MRENTPSDRVQVLGRGELQLPGACALCGSGNCDDGYVSFGIFFDFHGQFYLCMTCMEQAAEVAGCLTADETKYLQETNKSLATELKSTKAELEEANDLLSKWDGLIAAASGSVHASLAAALVDGDLVAEEPVSEPEGTSEPVKGADAGEPVAAEPVKGKRPPKSSQSVPSDTSEPAFIL